MGLAALRLVARWRHPVAAAELRCRAAGLELDRWTRAVALGYVGGVSVAVGLLASRSPRGVPVVLHRIGA